MTEQITVLEKVRKLLALADSPNENEAVAAASKAHALLIEHNLELRDVFADRMPAEFVIIVGGRTNRLLWVRRLGAAVANLYFGVYFFQDAEKKSESRWAPTRDEHYFVARQHNAEVAIDMWQYLVKAVTRLASEAAKTVSPDERPAFCNSFYEACSIRLGARIKEMIDFAKAGKKIASDAEHTTLPAVADMYSTEIEAATEFLKEETGQAGKQTSAKSRARKKSEDGARAGDEAGKAIHLGEQIESQTTDRIEKKD